jgi:hypothetical protein
MRCYKKAMFRTAITGTLAMVSLAIGLVTEASAGCVNPPGFKAGASRSRGNGRVNSGQARLCWSRTATTPLMGSWGSGE